MVAEFLSLSPDAMLACVSRAANETAGPVTEALMAAAGA